MPIPALYTVTVCSMVTYFRAIINWVSRFTLVFLWWSYWLKPWFKCYGQVQDFYGVERGFVTNGTKLSSIHYTKRKSSGLVDLVRHFTNCVFVNMCRTQWFLHRHWKSRHSSKQSWQIFWGVLIFLLFTHKKKWILEPLIFQKIWRGRPRW